MTSHLWRSIVAMIALTALVACTPEERDVAAGSLATSSPAVDTSYRTRPGYVVDSVLPAEEELRRFRVGLHETSSFSGGASSREALVRHFFAALSTADTAALGSLLLSRAEFAYLVYPSSPYARPPFRHPPELVWMQLEVSGATGLRRSLDRARGYEYLSHRCAAVASEREGKNRLWRQCRARVVRAPADTADVRLFGVIVERNGRFKFASYETDF